MNENIFKRNKLLAEKSGTLLRGAEFGPDQKLRNGNRHRKRRARFGRQKILRLYVECVILGIGTVSHCPVRFLIQAFIDRVPS